MEYDKKYRKLINFVGDGRLDKIVRTRATIEEKDNAEIYREAVQLYFEKYPLTQYEKSVVTKMPESFPEVNKK